MPFYERGPVRIHYEEVGSGFPLLLIPGGGLNSALSSWQTASPFNPMEVAMEVASLTRNAEVTIYPGKDSQEHIDEVIEHARRFLKAREPIRA